MADGRMSEQEEILKAAQSEISQVLTNAMGNMTPQSSNTEMSDFLKQNLSLESQVASDRTETPEYVQPMQDPYNKAIKYLENHNILQLFQVSGFSKD